jgi:hypothetical protein
MRILIFGTSLIVSLIVWATPGQVVKASSQTKAKLDVYPMNCTFEYVNDGSNQIVYLTPKECGQTTVTVGPSIQPASPSVEIVQSPEEDQIITVQQNPASANKLNTNNRLADPPKLVGQGAAASTITMWASLVTGAAVGVGLVMDFFISEFAVSKAAVGWAGSQAVGFGRFIRRLIAYMLRPPS